MLITILAGGTRGDTQPYIAIGLELKKAGHNVRIAAFENYEAFVKSFGLEFYKVKGDISAVASGEELKGAGSMSENKNPSFLYTTYSAAVCC